MLHPMQDSALLAELIFHGRSDRSTSDALRHERLQRTPKNFVRVASGGRLDSLVWGRHPTLVQPSRRVRAGLVEPRRAGMYNVPHAVHYPFRRSGSDFVVRGVQRHD
jgi:hypothetical protein